MEDIEDTDFVASEHDILVSAVSKLDKTQHITEPTRNEATSSNSEFNLIKRTSKIDINKVVKVLGETSRNLHISKQLKKSQNSVNILPKPLEKPQAERIKRATGYEQTKTKIGRWDPVVARSRTVDFVSFPLKSFPSKLQPTEEFIQKFKLKSPLEKELDEIDPPAVEENDDDEEQTYPMSYEEMVEHRQNLAKIRAQQSYKAAKAKRQSKIKSKKYHRILKKDRLKQQLKEFEELQKKNPEEALQKLEALEKSRALERHTLRHKNTGKWARNQLIRAKYDKDTRQQIAEQLAVSRSLTHKSQDTQSTDDEAEENDEHDDVLAQDPMNPWMFQSSNKSNINDEFNFGYKKYLKEKLGKKEDDSDSESNDDTINDDGKEINDLKESKDKLHQPEKPAEVIEYVIDSAALKKTMEEQKLVSKETQKKKQKRKPVVSTSDWVVETINPTEGDRERENALDLVANAFATLEDDVARKVEQKLKKLRANIERIENAKKPDGKKRKKEKEHDNLEYLKMKNAKPKIIIDEELNETDKANNVADEPKSSAKVLETAKKTVQKTAQSDIDPTRFIEVKPKYLNTALPNLEIEDELDDEQVVPKVNIEEVFEEDDVVASFRQEKEDEINKDQPTDIDLSLPGWGSWGGKGVKAPKRKRNRFILKAPPKMPRRDENKGDVIIKEVNNPKIASHKVTDVPFPFTSVKDYEASIRTPIGNTFIPEKAHKKLIRPNVITKAGTIIEPMDEEELLVAKNRNYKNKNVIKLLAKK